MPTTPAVASAIIDTRLVSSRPTRPQLRPPMTSKTCAIRPIGSGIGLPAIVTNLTRNTHITLISSLCMVITDYGQYLLGEFG